MKHNKEGIVLNGMYYLWKAGYNASGINDILKSCGIPKGSFYNLFETKEDFCIEALDLYCNIMHTAMEEYLHDKSFIPFERMKNFYMNQIEQSFDEGQIRGCFMCNLALEMSYSSKRIRKELTQHLSTNLTLLEKCMNEAEHRGMLNELLTPFQAAELIQNNWFGALLRSKATGKVESLNEFLIGTFEVLGGE
jgi:TetR/AcrR family transcriptional regulator, transcriptional repressor for nem operon